MEITKEQIVDYAVNVVYELNMVFQGLELNGTICLPKYKGNAIKDCFLARAKDLIMDSTREQLKEAYDECMDCDVIDEQGHGQLDKIVDEMFKIIGNKAPNPDNEKPIESVWFGYV